MTLDDKILINRIAQDILPFEHGESWFGPLPLEEKRSVLRELNTMILNASPVAEDAPEAIDTSGLMPTYTPCVLLRGGEVRAQIAKIANLPENELLKSLRLLIALLRLADERRRTRSPLDKRNHWWHRDLANPMVIAEIKKEFEAITKKVE